MPVTTDAAGKPHVTRVYVAGPMRGYSQFNFPAFHDATERLRLAGFDVRSPAEHDEETGFDPNSNSLDGFDLEAAFKWDVESVLWCEEIILLPGWRESSGACLEHSIAVATGKLIWEYVALDDGNYKLIMNAKETALDEASRIVNGNRRKEYGHPYVNFSRIAEMWKVIFNTHVSPYQVGLAMVALKLCREINSPTRDGRVDIAGYAETLELVQQIEDQNKTKIFNPNGASA